MLEETVRLWLGLEFGIWRLTVCTLEKASNVVFALCTEINGNKCLSCKKEATAYLPKTNWGKVFLQLCSWFSSITIKRTRSVLTYIGLFVKLVSKAPLHMLGVEVLYKYIVVLLSIFCFKLFSKSISPTFSLSPLLWRDERTSIPSTTVKSFSNPTALLPMSWRKGYWLGLLWLCYSSHFERRSSPADETDSRDGDLANNETPEHQII